MTTKLVITELKNEPTKLPKSPLFQALRNFNGKKSLKRVKKRKKIAIKPRRQLYEISHKNTSAKYLLIIDFQTNWYEQFNGAALADGTEIIIEQTQWSLIDIESSSNKNEKLVVELQPNKHIPNPLRSLSVIKFKPDFLLIRSLPTNIHGYHFLNILMAFMFADIPSINSLISIFQCMQRCLVYAQLHHSMKLPMIPMTYHPNFNSGTDSLLQQTIIPAVIKVGNCHSGYGKMRVFSESDLNDIQSIVILNKDYYTLEPYIENIDYEYRIQKIGDVIRVFRRIPSEDWKTHISSLIPLKCEIKHKQWIDRASAVFGGLDICALDVLHTKDINEDDIILELNDTAIGLMGAHEVEDESNIRDLVVNKMSELCKNCA